jgi:hypothetical protein
LGGVAGAVGVGVGVAAGAFDGVVVVDGVVDVDGVVVVDGVVDVAGGVGAGVAVAEVAVARVGSAGDSVAIVTSYRMIDRNDHTWADWVCDMVYACFPCGAGGFGGAARPTHGSGRERLALDAGQAGPGCSLSCCYPPESPGQKSLCVLTGK